jgi:2-amino-4-hydroxy-6-hydroxymethyldihydropteridine diphosphokinase
MPVKDAWIALGSNLGEREATLARAVELLGRRGVDPVRVSHLYETRPEGGKPEPMYLNAVMQARTDLEPRQLLDVLHQVEKELGRSRRAGPRTCDLDLLAVGDLVMEESPELRLPHPRLQSRSFVLVPLCELDVHWRHPALSRSAGEMLAALPTSPGEVRLHGPARAPARDPARSSSARRS